MTGIFLKIIFLFGVLSCLLFLPSTLHAAERYIVKSSILIPADWKDRITPTQIGQYKRGIFLGLEEVQKAYRGKLDGKTFNFDNQVQEVISSLSTIQLKDVTASGVYSIYEQVGGPQLFPRQDGIVNLVWVIGSADLVQTGASFVSTDLHSGEALMNHHDLLDLSNPFRQDWTLSVLAHELGHAFGLVFDGWARAHPCSEISPKECLQQAPEPLPKDEEYLNAIMGVRQLGLQGSHFNNSTYNPEICKIFQSPFINPQKDPCPPKTPPLLPEVIAKITDITPLEVAPGGIVEIKGTGFGEEIGGVVMGYNPYYYNQKPLLFNVLFWSDELIKIQVLRPQDLALQADSQWKIRILDTTSRVKATSEQFLTISSTKLPPFPITVEVSITCGLDRKAMSRVGVTFIRAYEPNTILVKAVTDETGKTTMTYTIEKPQPNDVYLVVPPLFEDAYPPQPNPIQFTVPSMITTYAFSSALFHYERCPESLSQDMEATPTPTPVESPSPQGQLEQAIISNYEDFRNSNAPKDEGSKTLVIENPQENQEIKWQASTLSQDQPVYVREVYDDGTVKDYSAELGSGEETQIGNVEIEEVEPEKVKTVKRISIGDEVIYSEEEGSRPLNLSLLGQTVFLIIVEYSDDTSKQFSLLFKKPEGFEVEQPEESEEQPQVQPQTCDPDSSGPEWEYKGCGDECPKERWYCSYDRKEYLFDNAEGECAC